MQRSIKVIGIIMYVLSTITSEIFKKYCLTIPDPCAPVINNSTEITRSMKVDYGERVILQCFAIGMPHPTISWFYMVCSIANFV